MAEVYQIRAEACLDNLDWPDSQTFTLCKRQIVLRSHGPQTVLRNVEHMQAIQFLGYTADISLYTYGHVFRNM